MLHSLLVIPKGTMQRVRSVVSRDTHRGKFGWILSARYGLARPLFKKIVSSSYAVLTVPPKRCKLVGRSLLVPMLLHKLTEIVLISPYNRALYERDAIETVSNLCAW
jgi:hypothetical protein